MTIDILPLLEQAVPVVTAFFGGIGVKILDKKRSKRSHEFDEAAKIREELREQIDTLHEELEGWKAEADEWRKMYWEQVEINILQKSAFESFKSEFDSLRREFDDMKERDDE